MFPGNKISALEKESGMKFSKHLKVKLSKKITYIFFQNLCFICLLSLIPISISRKDSSFFENM